MRKIIFAVLACGVLAGAGPAAQAFWPFKKKVVVQAPVDEKDRVSAPELEALTCAGKFDNSISSAIPPADYEALGDELADSLGLSDSQEQRLRELLDKHRQKFEERQKEYDKVAAELAYKRLELVGVRDKIQETIDRIPTVILTRLEDNQKRDYLAILEKQIAADGRKIKKVVPPPSPAAEAAAETEPEVKTAPDEPGEEAKPASDAAGDKSAEPKLKKKAPKKDEKPKLAPEFEGFNLPL